MSRVDTRQQIEREALKAVVTYGSRRIHAAQTDTWMGTRSYCGRPVQVASGTSRRVSCQDCLQVLRRYGYAG